MADTYMVVETTLKEKAATYDNKGEKDYKLTLDCPQMKSQFPLILYVPESIGDAFEGGAKTFVLRTNGKIKPDYTGEMPWHWKWRFVREADQGDGLTDFRPPELTDSGQAVPSNTQPQGPPAQGTQRPAQIDGMRLGNSLNVASTLAVAYPDMSFEEIRNVLMPLAAYLYSLSEVEIQSWLPVDNNPLFEADGSDVKNKDAMVGGVWFTPNEDETVWSSSDGVTLADHLVDTVATLTGLSLTKVAQDITKTTGTPLAKITAIVAQEYLATFDKEE